MKMKLLVICILMVSLFKLSLCSVCPQAELIVPCTCNNQFNSIHCNNVSNDRVLIEIFTRLRSELDKHHAGLLFDEFKLVQSPIEVIGTERDIFAGVAFRRISISRNSRLKRINADGFVASFNVTFELSFEDNKQLGASNSDTEALFEMIGHFKELQTLSMSDCGVRFIPQKAFARPQLALRELFLIDNRIEEVGEHAFRGLSALELINMDDNQIHRLATTAFDIGASERSSQQPMLRIFMRSNRLTANSFPAGIFSRLQRRTYLNIGVNNITTLRQNVFQSFFHRRSVLSVSKNPLRCDCDFKWLLDQGLLYNSSEPKREYLLRDYQCVSSKDEEQVIHEVDHDDFAHCIMHGDKEAIRMCLDQARSAEQEDQCFNRSNPIALQSLPALIFSHLLLLTVFRICNHEL